MVQNAVNPPLEDPRPIEECIIQVLQHLGIKQAHFAARMTEDWAGLATKFPEVISSLMVICRTRIDLNAVKHLTSQLLIVVAEQDPLAAGLLKRLADLPEATQLTLRNYEGLLWDNIVADHTDEIGASMLSFMAKTKQKPSQQLTSLSGNSGTIAGISYEIHGVGEPLVLLPLGLASSQWEPLLPKLSERYCTIVLGGTEFGIVRMLEARGRSTGYQRMLGNLLDEVQLTANETVLDVGCGTGVVARWLAHRTHGANQIIGVDVTSFLLKEARALARKENLDGRLEFREGNAENLPFPDNSFNVTMSTTVMEEVDADKMLAEMIRVTKPSGRVGVIVRATDIPQLTNLPVHQALKAKYEYQPWPGEGKGCASASLYQRFQGSELTNIKMFPHLAVFDNPNGVTENFMQAGFFFQISPEEATAWRSAIAKAKADGTFFLTWPHHCAVGTKPR